MHDLMRPQPGGSPRKVTGLFLLYGLVHSLLASDVAKRTFARLFGERTRAGVYRPFYNAQAVVTTAGTAWAFLRLRDRPLYRVKAPLSFALHAVQLFGAALLLSALNVTGLHRIIGLPQLWAYLRGQHPQREYEAQGPPPQALENPRRRGPFLWIRHPENLAFVLILWALPTMTVNRLTLAILTTLYSVVGSWHEDFRLEGAYGESFRRYRRQTPMLVPRPRR